MVAVIDAVFEDLRCGLERHEPKLAQRRVAMAKYLGEMYNYRLVESGAVLNMLYAIVSLGVQMADAIAADAARAAAAAAVSGAGGDANAEPLAEASQPPLPALHLSAETMLMDPPESLFRLKLACVLLETCGQYFTSAVSRQRLDYYLVFLQQYYWYKKSHPMYATSGGSGGVAGTQSVTAGENAANLFPILADYHYRETLIGLRPKIRVSVWNIHFCIHFSNQPWDELMINSIANR